MLPQPKEPKFKLAMLEVYVRDKPFGGADKSSNGHRYDTVPFVNGMIMAGMSCQPIHYKHEEHDKFFEVCANFDALIIRCNPGQINDDGGDQKKFDDAVRELQKKGIQAWPSPDVMEFMGAKDALTKICTLNIGLEDTLTCYDEAAFIEGFKKTMKFQPRVIKQNRGSAGEGIWIIKLKEGNYCGSFGERSCDDGEVLSLMEANDNHAEEHTVAEFIEWCINGGTDSIYTYYGPEEPKFANLTQKFLTDDIDKVMPALELPDEPIPLWWTGDFILASPEGTPAEEEKWIIGEFNCSCVGISKCLPAYCKEDTPEACWNDIPDEDKKAAMSYGETMGVVGLKILEDAKK